MSYGRLELTVERVLGNRIERIRVTEVPVENGFDDDTPEKPDSAQKSRGSSVSG